MAKSSNLYVRIEPEIKEQAEKVLDRMGISMSNAVGMFLNQVVINQGIPFDLRTVPAGKTAVSDMTDAELDAELEKGYAQYLAGKGRPARDVIRELRDELHI